MSASSNFQKTYFRARESHVFDGIRRGDTSTINTATASDVQGKFNGLEISQTTSNIDSRIIRFENILSEKYEDTTHNSPFKGSPSDIILEPLGTSSSGKWLIPTKNPSSKIIESNTVGKSNRRDNELSNNYKDSSPQLVEGYEKPYALASTAMPTIETSYSANKREASLSRIPLPPSAALFYNGYYPSEMELVVEPPCESIRRLNSFLKAAREDVNAGVPGRFLHAVMGQDACDVGCVASTIMYAFYLNETVDENGQKLCTVPVINMKRADLSSRSELKWLLHSCQIDDSSLFFVDEIDLSYYDLFGSLKLVLLNGSKLPTKQEELKDALVEIVNCKKGDAAYPWVDSITMRQDCSYCTVVAEKFALTSPEILIGKGFSRLLLAGILLDTGNLSNPNCTSKDKYMATLLINGAGRYGCNGLYQILKYKMYDVSNLKIREILCKEFKKWTRIGKPDSTGSRLMVSHVGMSSIGMSILQLLAHSDTSVQEIFHFQQTEKLRLLMIVSGYYDSQKNFKREILVSAESTEVMKTLIHFFSTNATEFPFKVLHQPGLRNEMKIFELDNVISRKTIELLLEEFGGASKG